MSDLNKQLKSLCTPAQIYFFISMLSILVIMGQNAMSSHIYVVGKYSVQSPVTNTVAFLIKIAGIVIWTYILKYLCDNGHLNIAWFLVLLPILLMFLIIGAVLLILSENKKSIRSQIKAFQESQKPGKKQMNIKINEYQ